MGLREEIADRLTQARVSAKLERKDAAESMGIPYQTYAAHENTQRSFDVETAVQYCRRFKVSVDWLLTGNGRGPGGVETPIRGNANIQSVLNRIEGLKPADVTVLLAAIQGFQSANAAAQPSPAQQDGQSELASDRRESSPS